MSWYITNLLAAFLLPPLNLLLISISGLMLWYRYPKIARILLGSSVAILWVLSTPTIAESMLRSLETPYQALDKQRTAEAIVVLGGGSYFNAPEYSADTVSSASLQRLRYASKLYKEFNIPVMLSGGTPAGTGLTEARQMKAVLDEELGARTQWLEEESSNTFESAQNSYRILHQQGISRIYLVTHAWHMQRSMQAFKIAGFEVIAAPTMFTTYHQNGLLAWIPSASALHESQIYLHEIIGINWYRLKSWYAN